MRGGIDIEIDQLRLGQPLGGDALGQGHAAVATRLDVGEAFQRGGGAAEHHRSVGGTGANQRQIARVIAKALLLLVAGVMLFIDDHQPQRAEGGEDRRAGADQDARLPFADGEPGLAPLGIAQTGVKAGDHRTKAVPEARGELRCQADFRAQHQHLATCREGGFGQPQIQLGLAGAGHAFQQADAKALARLQSRQRGGLRGGQRWAGPAGGLGRGLGFSHGPAFCQQATARGGIRGGDDLLRQ